MIFITIVLYLIGFVLNLETEFDLINGVRRNLTNFKKGEIYDFFIEVTQFSNLFIDITLGLSEHYPIDNFYINEYNDRVGINTSYTNLTPKYNYNYINHNYKEYYIDFHLIFQIILQILYL